MSFYAIGNLICAGAIILGIALYYVMPDDPAAKFVRGEIIEGGVLGIIGLLMVRLFWREGPD